MFKHTVEYKDYNDQPRKEDLYFHLATHEMVRIEAEIGKNLQEHIQDLTLNNKSSELLAFLEKMLLSSYGEKTADGKSFYKTKEIREAFEYSQAYAEIFEDIILDSSLAQRFGEKVTDGNKDKKNHVPPQVVVDNKPSQ